MWSTFKFQLNIVISTVFTKIHNFIKILKNTLKIHTKYSKITFACHFLERKNASKREYTKNQCMLRAQHLNKPRKLYTNAVCDVCYI